MTDISAFHTTGVSSAARGQGTTGSTSGVFAAGGANFWDFILTRFALEQGGGAVTQNIGNPADTPGNNFSKEDISALLKLVETAGTGQDNGKDLEPVTAAQLQRLLQNR